MEPLDCLIIGAGPAGLISATYLVRFRRRVRVIHDNASRASLIPLSHNCPGFPVGISGNDLLARLEQQAVRYGATITKGHVESLHRTESGFRAHTEDGEISASTVLLATGVVDIEPDLPGLPNAIQQGYLRHCPICDAFEVIDRNVAIVGVGPHVVREALFLRTYTPTLTVLTLGQRLTDTEHGQLAGAGVRLIEDTIENIHVEGDRVGPVCLSNGDEHRFDTLYSALGARNRSELASRLGATVDKEQALVVDSHMRTTIPGLYAAGDVVQSLNQISVAAGHAAIAATDIHNRLRGAI